jgi:hypothetical protein
MARQQVNVRLSSYTVAQLKDLAGRFDMSESTVIMLAIDRLARDTQHGIGVVTDETGNRPEGTGQTGETEEMEHRERQVKGGQGDGDGEGKVRKEARTRRRHNP